MPKRGRENPESVEMNKEAGEELLKVYLGTWYQYHCHAIPRTHEKLKLPNMVNYWYEVDHVAPDDNMNDFKSWLDTLPWPCCWYNAPVDDDMHEHWLSGNDDVFLSYDVLRTKCPNFRGCVRYTSISWRWGGAKDRDLTNLPVSVHRLELERCYYLTDFGFQHLSNLTSLRLRSCGQSTITDAGFQHLSNLTFFKMEMCSQSTITDAGFQHLSNLTFLKMVNCKQTTITDAAFQHLSRLTSLVMFQCNRSTITDSAFQHLLNLSFLVMIGCNQSTITDAAFQHLSNLTSLKMGRCNQSTITDAGFQHLSNLTFLKMANCKQTTITDAAFQHLSNLTSLEIVQCTQSTITDAAFQHLSNLRSLVMVDCNKSTVTDATFQHLSNLRQSCKIREFLGESSGMQKMRKIHELIRRPK